METYKFRNEKTVLSTEDEDVLRVAGAFWLNTKRKTDLPVLPIGKYLIKTTEDALNFADVIWLHGEFDNFRDCVRFWLKATAYRKGLNYVLKITGLSKASYYRGVGSKHERKNSDFDKYLAGLYPVEMIFDAMREQYENDVFKGKKGESRDEN